MTKRKTADFGHLQINDFNKKCKNMTFKFFLWFYFYYNKGIPKKVVTQPFGCSRVKGNCENPEERQKRQNSVNTLSGRDTKSKKGLSHRNAFRPCSFRSTLSKVETRCDGSIPSWALHLFHSVCLRCFVFSAAFQNFIFEKLV